MNECQSYKKIEPLSSISKIYEDNLYMQSRITFLHSSAEAAHLPVPHCLALKELSQL